MNHEETYLGDGLYASFDGWSIILRAPRSNGDHFVGLEPEVFASLLAYQKAMGGRKTGQLLPAEQEANAARVIAEAALTPGTVEYERIHGTRAE